MNIDYELIVSMMPCYCDDNIVNGLSLCMHEGKCMNKKPSTWCIDVVPNDKDLSAYGVAVLGYNKKHTTVFCNMMPLHIPSHFDWVMFGRMVEQCSEIMMNDVKNGTRTCICKFNNTSNRTDIVKPFKKHINNRCGYCGSRENDSRIISMSMSYIDALKK